MNPSELALRMIVARVLKDLLAGADSADREEARESWVVGDRLGAKLGGRAVGHAQVKKGVTRASITDAQAFEAWVYANQPTEIEFLSSVQVRPAYQRAVLDAAKKQGIAVTAEGEEIPGITVSQGDPTVAVVLAEDAVALVAEAWASGELWEIVGSLLPQISPAEAAGAPTLTIVEGAA